MATTFYLCPQTRGKELRYELDSVAGPDSPLVSLSERVGYAQDAPKILDARTPQRGDVVTITDLNFGGLP
jgi:hypothetical protein